VGLLVVLAAGGASLRAPGVWWTQVDVVFLAPTSARYPNSLEVTSASLISTAGVVERRVNAGRVPTAVSSSSVSLVGEGIRDGYSVRLPNAGGQWAENFSRPVLDVQVVGASRDVVAARLDILLAKIQTTLDELQVSGGADKFNLIITESAPRVPVQTFVGPRNKRAAAGIGVLGSLITLATVVAVDRVIPARSRQRPAAIVDAERPRSCDLG
jgi:hypothetical protein